MSPGGGGAAKGEEGALSLVLGAGGVARWPEAGTGGLQVQLVLGLQLPGRAEEKGNPRQRERRSWAWSLKGQVGAFAPGRGRRCHSGRGRGLPTALHCGLFILLHPQCPSMFPVCPFICMCPCITHSTGVFMVYLHQIKNIFSIVAKCT